MLLFLRNPRTSNSYTRSYNEGNWNGAIVTPFAACHHRQGHVSLLLSHSPSSSNKYALPFLRTSLTNVRIRRAKEGVEPRGSRGHGRECVGGRVGE